MSKKTMLLALAACSALLLAVPALASASEWHISKTGTFSISGGASNLTTASGLVTECTSVSGSGEYTTTTTGTLQLIFHGCTGSGTNCTSTGQPTGTIKTNVLPFHNVEIPTGKPGILITPSSITGVPTTGQGPYATYTCASGLIKVEVFGNGVLGTVTSPGCGGEDTKATLSFKKSANGVQEHLSYTNTTYDLFAKVNGGSHVTAAMEGHGTAAFTDGAKRKVECT